MRALLAPFPGLWRPRGPARTLDSTEYTCPPMLHDSLSLSSS